MAPGRSRWRRWVAAARWRRQLATAARLAPARRVVVGRRGGRPCPPTGRCAPGRRRRPPHELAAGAGRGRAPSTACVGDGPSAAGRLVDLGRWRRRRRARRPGLGPPRRRASAAWLADDGAAARSGPASGARTSCWSCSASRRRPRVVARAARASGSMATPGAAARRAPARGAGCTGPLRRPGRPGDAVDPAGHRGPQPSVPRRRRRRRGETRTVTSALGAAGWATLYVGYQHIRRPVEVLAARACAGRGRHGSWSPASARIRASAGDQVRRAESVPNRRSARIGWAPVPPFQVVSEFEPAGDQPQAIAQPGRGHRAGRPLPDAARHHRLRQERHHRLDHRAGAEADARPRAQQEPGRPAGQRVPRVLPPQPGRVLRQLLRLLPARGVHPVERHLHREGQLDQRRDRPAAPLAPPPALLTRRDVIVVASVSCIYGLGNPEEYRGQPARAAHRRRLRPALHPAQARRPAVRPQRHDPRSGQVPGAGRHHRGPPRLRRDGAAHRDVRRHGRAPHRRRPAHRRAAARRSTEVIVFPATHYVAGDERMQRGRRAASRPSCRSGWPTSRRRASCSRPSGCGCAPSTTSR